MKAENTTLTLKGFEFEITHSLFGTKYRIELAFNEKYKCIQLLESSTKTGTLFETIEEATKIFEEKKEFLTRTCK